MDALRRADLHRETAETRIHLSLDLDGIGFVKESKRFYPNSEVAAHVDGFTATDPGARAAAIGNVKNAAGLTG